MEGLWAPSPAPRIAPSFFLRRTRVPFKKRYTWSNHDGNQSIDPLQVFKPRADELPQIVRDAEEQNTTVRGVGSGHSWSDAALTPGKLILPDNLSGILDIEDHLMQARPDGAPRLVRFGSGTTIKDLNAYLNRHGLALPNMGGFDGQTWVGATATSTHGTGAAFGPLSDLTRSFDLVATGGRRYRIERASGPTDAALYRAAHPERTLIQDDHWFRAVSVGLGSMGIIESAIIETRPAFHLREVRSMTTWDHVRGRIPDQLQNNQHYEVLLSPYEWDGKIRCLETRRNEITPQEFKKDLHRTRNFFAELIGKLWIASKIVELLNRFVPSLTPFLDYMTLKGLEKRDYVNRSFKVFNIGSANNLPAYSMEIGVPVDGRNLHLKAVEKIIEVADKHRRLGNVYQTGPISLRFVKATDSYLSMMEGRDTMMIELIMVNDSQGGQELLADYEDVLFRECDGRPHWGQVNHLTEDRIRRLYPNFDNWLDIYGKLNQSGVFNSPMTRRVGISG